MINAEVRRDLLISQILRRKPELNSLKKSIRKSCQTDVGFIIFEARFMVMGRIYQKNTM
jgi:hypothetical protein